MSQASFRFSSVSLGCSKNLVDLEFAIGEILKFSDRIPIEYFDDPEDPDAEFVLVNTCGFLSSAREESEATMRHYDALGKKIVLMGCYVSVKDDAFLSSLQNLYGILSFVDYGNIEKLLFGVKPALGKPGVAKLKDALSQAKEGKLAEYLGRVGESGSAGKAAFVWKGDEVRAYMHAPFRYEYLKVAEGCDNTCTFCIIPKIRGKQKSRPIDDVVKEVEAMVANGIREIEIIAQDTTRYGSDLLPAAGQDPKNLKTGEGFSALATPPVDSETPTTAPAGTVTSSSQNTQTASLLLDLLERLGKLPGDFRYRTFYLYPDTLTLGHLDRLAKLKKFLPYFDIPFQHSHPDILKKMGRFYDRAHMDDVLKAIRSKFPKSFIRTSFIVGFPGEGQAEFDDLLEFVRKNRFESVGIFQYHDEPLAASSKLPGKVDETVARKRVDILAKTAAKTYDELDRADRGKEFEGYVMDVGDKTVTVRREIRAPEIDDYEEIPFSRVISADSNEVGIGSFIRYRAK
jgi:ribosomal protein S12 methylthiotransferase